MSKGKVTVTTSTTQIVAANLHRNGIIIENKDAQEVWIDCGDDAVEDEGFTLQRNEKLMLLRGNLLGKESIQQAWNGLVKSGTALVTFKELF